MLWAEGKLCDFEFGVEVFWELGSWAYSLHTVMTLHKYLHTQYLNRSTKKKHVLRSNIEQIEHPIRKVFIKPTTFMKK